MELHTKRLELWIFSADTTWVSVLMHRRNETFAGTFLCEMFFYRVVPLLCEKESQRAYSFSGKVPTIGKILLEILKQLNKTMYLTRYTMTAFFTCQLFCIQCGKHFSVCPKQVPYPALTDRDNECLPPDSRGTACLLFWKETPLQHSGKNTEIAAICWCNFLLISAQLALCPRSVCYSHWKNYNIKGQFGFNTTSFLSFSYHYSQSITLYIFT